MCLCTTVPFTPLDSGFQSRAYQHSLPVEINGAMACAQDDQVRMPHMRNFHVFFQELKKIHGSTVHIDFSQPSAMYSENISGHEVGVTTEVLLETQVWTPG